MSSIRIISPERLEEVEVRVRAGGDATLVPEQRRGESKCSGALPDSGGPVQEKRVRAGLPSGPRSRSRFASGCSGTDAKGSIHLLRERIGGPRRRRGRRSAPGNVPRAVDSRPRRACGTPRTRARAGRARRWSRRPISGHVQREQERVVRQQTAKRCKVQVEHAFEPELASHALICDRRVEVAVTGSTVAPRSSAGPITSSTCWARAAA